MFSPTFVVVSLFALLQQASVSDATQPSLSILTFNIRYGTAKDEGHLWETRKAAVAEVLREHRPDVAGLQEALDFQVEFLRKELSGEYSLVGEGREGGVEGEFSPILYRSERFLLARAGRFWLSDTPSVVGSKTWASLPRIVTWVELIDRFAEEPLLVFNTHWAHDSDEARLASAKLIRMEVDRIAERESAVILMGDFNCVPESDPYRVLVDGKAESFGDALSAGKEGGISTFHGFRGSGGDRGPIDWILFRGDLQAKEYRVLVGEYLGELPSDHYPVFAQFER